MSIITKKPLIKQLYPTPQAMNQHQILFGSVVFNVHEGGQNLKKCLSFSCFDVLSLSLSLSLSFSLSWFGGSPQFNPHQTSIKDNPFVLLRCKCDILKLLSSVCHTVHKKFLAALVAFAEEILNGKLYILCSDNMEGS